MIEQQRIRKALLGLSVTAAILVSNGAVGPLPWAVAQSVPVEVKQGIENYNKGWLGKAIPSFEEASRKYPDNTLGHLWLARSYKKQGEFEKARLAFARLIELDPNNVEALSALGEIYSWDVSRREEAIALLRRASILAPGNAEVKKQLAEVLHWTGRNDEAFDYAQNVVDDYSNDKGFLTTYARILTATGHPGNAVTIYEDFLDIHTSGDLALRVAYAEALSKSGDTLRAGDLYDALKPEVTGLDNSSPDNINLKKSMGGLAFDLGKHWDAIEFDESLPDEIKFHRDTQLRVARAYVKTYRIPEAIETFNSQYRQGNLQPSEKVEFADYLKSLSLPPASLPSPNIIENLYTEAIQETPNDAQAAHRLARLYAEQSNVAAASQYYMQAYDTWPRPVVGTPQDISRHEVKEELLEFLKASAQGDPQGVESTLQSLIAQHPGDYQIRGTYAEFLSYDPARREESMRMLIELARTDVEHPDYWLYYLNRTLLWHEPSTNLIPVYQEIVDTFPNNKTIWMSVARAYRNNPGYFYEALDLYAALKRKYPDDGIIADEWVGMIMSDQIKRKEAIRILRETIAQSPGDLSAHTALGKLYSYDRKFKDSFREFETVLAAEPNHKEALSAKGFTLIWSGRRLQAKKFLEYARSLHPADVDVAVALAQANKRIGRYDNAFQIMDEIRPLLNHNYNHHLNHEKQFIPVAYSAPKTNALLTNAVYDYSIVPAPANDHQLLALAPVPQKEETLAMPMVSQNDISDLQSEIDSLNMALESLSRVQDASDSQMEKIDSLLSVQREGIPEEVAIHDRNSDYRGSLSLFENNPLQNALFHSLPYDTQPLRSGLGRFRNDDLVQMEKGLINDLRPMLRAGYDFLNQEGGGSTSKFRYYGFPTEVALSLTPQTRGRFGFNGYKYYIPGNKSREPDDTWGLGWAWGLTAKPTDKLTLDGDMSLTQFTQSDSSNLTWRGGAKYDFNDAITAGLYTFRQPQTNSLLTYAGLRPDRGAFRGRLLGQSRETGFGAELNTNPFSQNIDWNLGYEFAWVEGSRVPTGIKNLAYTSLGYTYWFNNHHRVRPFGEFVYFGYSKNATNGFFDTTNAGVRQPVVSLNPVALANRGYDFGGYYSPSWFIQNDYGLEFKGDFWNNFFNYTLGAKLGFQNFHLGHGIDRSEPVHVSFTQEYYADAIMNFTDWLAAYGNVDYTDAGGAFSRWRFGGGLILRPSIEFLSPVFRRHRDPLFTPRPTTPVVDNIPDYPVIPEQARLPEPTPDPLMPNPFTPEPEPPPKKFVPGYW